MPGNLTRIKRREIMEAANKKGLTVDGKPVLIEGWMNDRGYARIVEDPTYSAKLWFAWAVIERAIRGDGRLRS